MKIFDFNIHLPYLLDKDVNRVIQNDMALDTEGLRHGFATHSNVIESVTKCNILLFNTKLFEAQIPLTDFFKTPNTVFTALVDFRRPDLLNYLEAALASGIKAIMFNSYLQCISDADFLLVHKACKFAEEHGLIICIDGSFGTSKMYAYDNVRLACFIADLITDTPIIIVHSGGKRILDMMALALDKANVWLDTSFSLPFYIGSSLETDFAFAYKKIGTDRIVFGSDHPYMDFKITQQIHLDFFSRHAFNDNQIENIMYDNAARILT